MVMAETQCGEWLIAATWQDRYLIKILDESATIIPYL